MSVTGAFQMLSLLAILCPPLAVLVAERSGLRTATNLGLTLLLYFPGLFHALSTIERRDLGRRYETVMRVLERRAA
jgi:uncharacterized membrane protein YqaE (UPF0057 family)